MGRGRGHTDVRSAAVINRKMVFGLDEGSRHATQPLPGTSVSAKHSWDGRWRSTSADDHFTPPPLRTELPKYGGRSMLQNTVGAVHGFWESVVKGYSNPTPRHGRQGFWESGVQVCVRGKELKDQPALSPENSVIRWRAPVGVPESLHPNGDG